MDVFSTDNDRKVMIGMTVYGAVILVMLIVVIACENKPDRNNRTSRSEWMKELCPVKEFQPDFNTYILDEHYDYKNIEIRHDGTAVVREYTISDDTGDYELYAIKDFYGGGCMAGIIPEESIPESVTDEDLMFFGERSLGSLTEGECYLVFNKLVINLMTVQTHMNDEIDHDIGVRLLCSYGAFMADDMKHLGYNPESVVLISSSVGLRAFEADENYGDIYGWYIIEITTMDGSKTELMEGFAILHSRPYGFSAENYLGIVCNCWRMILMDCKAFLYDDTKTIKAYNYIVKYQKYDLNILIKKEYILWAALQKMI